MASITLKGVSKAYGKHDAVIRNVDLHIAQGEFCVFVGASGCGKSTLLRMIAGLEEIDSGKLLIDDRLVNDVPAARRGVAMVFQSYALFPHMTVYENMAFGLTLAKVDKAVVREKVVGAARILQLEHLLARLPKALSGGQRQRVAIGRAIVREPGVFLFDEPLSNLDAVLRVQTRYEIAKIHREIGRASTVYVTHDQVEAMTLATRTAVMRGGKIQQIGTPAQVYAEPANLFVASFLGSPGMNLLTGRLRVSAGTVRFEHAQLALDVGSYPFRQPPADGTRCVLGIRPEDVQLGPALAYQAHVSLVEPMGNHRVIWLAYHDCQISAIAQDKATIVVDQALSFDFDSAHISLFDEASGERL